MNEVNYEELKSEILELLDQNKTMVLATSAKDKVTARSMTCIHKDLKIYCQTDKNTVKYEQILQNPKVALCISNIQIEGVAEIKGHPFDEENKEFLEAYKKEHRGAFKLYSDIKSEVVIMIKPTLITLWKYEESKPCREILNIEEKKAYRNYYKTERIDRDNEE